MTYYEDAVYDVRNALYSPIYLMDKWSLEHMVGAGIPVGERETSRREGTGIPEERKEEFWRPAIDRGVPPTRDYYTAMKALPLVTGGTWGDYGPSGDPTTNWDEWISAARAFFAGDMGEMPSVDRPDSAKWKRPFPPGTLEEHAAITYIWSLHLGLCAHYNEEVLGMEERMKSTDRVKQHQHPDLDLYGEEFYEFQQEERRKFVSARKRVQE
jgi:hypothetical protein